MRPKPLKLKQEIKEIENRHPINKADNDLHDKSITDVFWPQNMDYSKYLVCPACLDSGLYCTEHRIGVWQILEKERLGKYSKFHAPSPLNILMQSSDY